MREFIRLLNRYEAKLSRTETALRGYFANGCRGSVETRLRPTIPLADPKVAARLALKRSGAGGCGCG